MSISKTITITAGALGGKSCDLTLAFVPPEADFKTVQPIAWQVFSLVEEQSFVATWNNGLAACRASIDKDYSTLSAVEYIPIAIKQTSDLKADKSKRPPVYSFSTPKTWLQPRARIMNRTGGSVNIGAGFIADIDTDNEAMNSVLVWNNVADQDAAYMEYTPTLKLWATLDYEQSQLLEPDVNDVAPLWEGTLTQITGKKVDITVKREKGKLVADGPSSAHLPGSAAFLSAAASVPRDQATTYAVDLSFATPGLVSDGIQAIVEQLRVFNPYYSFKLIHKGYDTEARLEVVLPESVSCNDAELNTIEAIEATTTIYGKAFIKGHSGVTLVSAADGFEKWIEVNPASPQWFAVKPGSGGNAAFNGTNAEAFAKGNPEVGGANGGDEAANGSAIAGTPARRGKAVKGKGSVYDDNNNFDAEDSGAASPRVEAQDDGDKYRSIRRGGAAARRAII